MYYINKPTTDLLSHSAAMAYSSSSDLTANRRPAVLNRQCSSILGASSCSLTRLRLRNGMDGKWLLASRMKQDIKPVALCFLSTFNPSLYESHKFLHLPRHYIAKVPHYSFFNQAHLQHHVPPNRSQILLASGPCLQIRLVH